MHGGLRYLETGDLKLVLEANRERRILLRIAPHLVWPLSFIFPLHRGDRIPLWRLAAGMWVFCDRHADSTVVYQGYGRGLDIERLKEWNRFATGGLTPDVTFLVDIDPEAGLSRISDKDRLDAEPLEFHVRVREGFVAEAALEPRRWVMLDGSLNPESVLREAESALASRRP